MAESRLAVSCETHPSLEHVMNPSPVVFFVGTLVLPVIRLATFGDEDRLLSSGRTKRLPDDRPVDGGFRYALDSP